MFSLSHNFSIAAAPGKIPVKTSLSPLVDFYFILGLSECRLEYCLAIFFIVATFAACNFFAHLILCAFKIPILSFVFSICGVLLLFVLPMISVRHSTLGACSFLCDKLC